MAESPTNFYFQILDNNFYDHQKVLKCFNESMDYAKNKKKCQEIREGPIINNFFFYNHTYKIKILLGTICTVKYGKFWERALIEKVNVKEKTVSVFFF